MMADLESILYFMESTFQPGTFPDYPHALNGLQVAGPMEVDRIGTAVDASERTIEAAVTRNVDLLLVHHGLFWEGTGPIVGPRFRKLAALIAGEMALFSLHLPLDAHEEMGNCALMARALGLEPQGRFGSFQGVEIGWWARSPMHRDELLRRMGVALGGEVRLVPGGPEKLEKVGILTGAGASALREAASAGLDALVTGEAPHHAFHDSMEWGVNLYLGGHYATETFGVKALGERLSKEFSVEWEFLDFPTGL